ncbi:MAG: NAD(P)/FAD-dependent oxidoreductase [Desulfomonilaceae bacterium]
MTGKSVNIIGAGVTGLTAAYCLSSFGWKVRVIESSVSSGGLAGSVELMGVPVEKYYHFICREDHDLVNFIDRLGITEELTWNEASTSFFVDGKIIPFNTPFDLLKFSPAPFSQRLRFGIHVLFSQLRRDWFSLDKIPAKPWLIKNIGSSAYKAIWDPLLRIKFGKYHEQISAAWIWHRIHRVARSRTSMLAVNSYGFLKRGCYDLISTICQKLFRNSDFEILKGKAVKRIVVEDGSAKGVELDSGELIFADATISTCAIPNFLDLLDFNDEFTKRLKTIKFINVVCMVMLVRQPFTDNFWLNVNDPEIAFNGIVETTNLNPRPDLNSSKLLYIPYYTSPDNPKWHASDEDLFKEYLAALKRIKPGFKESDILEWRVFRDWNAQAVCSVGFKDIMPGHETSIRNLFITDSSQYYPEDRTLSASVRLGRTVADIIDSKKT